MADDEQDEMTPEKAARVARALFIITPIMIPFLWILTAVQGADTRACLIVTAAGTLMCLCAALLFKLRGTSAPNDAQWIHAILKLLSGIKR
jgi:hypothetical protein